jgi:transposase
MARVAGHLGVAELEERYRSCADATEARHVQAVWLLAEGREVAEVSATVAFGRRWVERLLARYNERGPAALGDLRRGNGTRASVLVPALLERLRVRLVDPPAEGGVWTSGKVARWMAGELGLEAVAPQRGWEALKALGWSIQSPRPRHPASATPEEREAFKKSSPRPRRKRRPGIRADRSRSSPPTSTASG